MPTSNSGEAGGELRRALGPRGHLPLAVTMGDPAGIGPDIALASWLQRTALALPPFVLLGDPDALAQRAQRLGLAVPIESVADLEVGRAAFAEAMPVQPVQGAGAGDQAMIVAGIEQATLAALEGRALAVVTNPSPKSALNFADLAYPGHTEYLARLAERHVGGPRPRPVMMLVAEELKVVPATVHVPLTAVAPLLSAELLRQTITITAAALARDFGIGAPGIAATGR